MLLLSSLIWNTAFSESWFVTLNRSEINNHVYRSQVMNYNHLLNHSMPLPNIYTEMIGWTFSHQTNFWLPDFTIFLFISGVTFFFSEACHSVYEGRDPPVIIAPLSKNPDTRLANPVTFKVFPVTIDEANMTGWPIPSGAQLVNNPDSPFIASKSSFEKKCLHL